MTVVEHTLSADQMSKATGTWIIDSGATCHICNDCTQFVELYPVKKLIVVKLGDGRTLNVVAQGTVSLRMKYG